MGAGAGPCGTVGFVLIDLLTLVGLLLWSFKKQPLLSRVPRNVVRRGYSWVRRHPGGVCMLVGVLAFLLSAAPALVTGFPEPAVHDEFSYLLAADTFAQGRLANPPHPLWPHFEAIHIIQQPTYASKYPPGQGLALALGQVFMGHPVMGVWLSVALACAALTWMLAGYVPWRWALWGGLLAAVRLGFSGPAFWLRAILNPTVAYWSQSYWGGAVAALGGALVFGALPRLLRRPRRRDALWLALGLLILANSRPFEGLVASVPALVVLGVGLARSAPDRRRLGGRLAAPAGLVLLLGALWMGYYNFRLTGHPLTLPYQVHESTYAVAPVFLWQSLRPEPRYQHAWLRDFHAGWAKNQYLQGRTLPGWAWQSAKRAALLGCFFFGLVLLPVTLVCVRLRHRPAVKFALAVWGLMLAVLLSETYFYPHYAAPVTGLAFLLIVEGMRRARRFTWRGRPVGARLVSGSLPALLVAGLFPLALQRSLQPPDWVQERAAIRRQLEQEPGRHLVVLRYPPGHSFDELWGYNGADLEGAKVIWAAERSPHADRELLAHFRGRRTWLLLPRPSPARLLPYPDPELTGSGP